MTYAGFVRALILTGALSAVLCLPLACASKTPPIESTKPVCGILPPELFCCVASVDGLLLSRCVPVEPPAKSQELPKT